LVDAINESAIEVEKEGWSRRSMGSH